ncbi:MAG TPA: AI-2E family transporter [Syntrophorhabdales bacterium]|nr:AI-2E family transporter [Syntrophorhabdales bacterium]
MQETKFQLLSHSALVLLLGYAAYLIFRPFFVPIGWAIVFAIVLYPVHNFFLKYVKMGAISAVVILILILIITLGPLSYVSYQLAVELQNISFEHATEEIVGIFNHPWIKPLVERVLSLFSITEEQFRASVVENLTKLGKNLLGPAGGRISDIITGAFDFVLMAFTLFFLLKDGPKFLEKLRDYMPFPEYEKKQLAKQIKDVVVSTIYGGVVVALAQGLIGVIAFAVVGIHAPVLWGMAMSITSFIPIVGCALIWVPATLYLFAKGLTTQAVILAAIGIFVISAVDNILRPIIIRGRVSMPLLLVFFSVFGGIQVFGLLGLVLGPLVVAVFASVVGIFRTRE